MAHVLVGMLAAGLLGAGPAQAVPATKQAPAVQATEWRAGTAAVKITPQKPMWMAGYAARNKPSEGVAQDLFAKALAIEDAQGTRLVFVTLDLIGVPRAMRENVQKQILEKHRLPPQGLLLAASHTHSGPEFRPGKISDQDQGSERAREEHQYEADLEQKLVALVGEALGHLAPARLDYLHARAGFAMNRRRPTEKGVANSPNSAGPVDHDVPVLRVSDAAGKLQAVLFGYACHNTTLGWYKFCGDYAGFAQQYFQEAHPGVTALFMMGCGGDQNPYPRRTEELAQTHGRTLAVAVDAALDTVPRPLHGPLRSAIEEVKIDFAPPPSREELQKLVQSKTPLDHARGTRLLTQIDSGTLRTDYPYLVQVVRFGGDLVLVALSGEVVVDYSLRLKRELSGPAAVWVAGYTNDVMGYVCSARVIQEGGYEPDSSTHYSSLPGPFDPSLEERIVGKVHELAGRLK